jgi:putative ABC transport system substrate-binding protein
MGKTRMKKQYGGWLVVMLSLWVVSAPALARQDGKPVIGFLAFEAGGCKSEPFHRGMRELHYVQGRNIEFDCRHANGRYADLDSIAAELVRNKPDIIVTIGHVMTQAAQQATRDIPIVMVVSGEPVAAGLIASFPRPGGNVTGLSYFNTELNIKRLEFLRAIVPRLTQLAVLVDPTAPEDLNRSYLRDAATAGEALGFQIHVVEATTVVDLDRAFEAMMKKNVQAVFVPPKLRHAGEIERIVELARRHRLPTMHYANTFPEIGGLLSYGANYAEVQRRVAVYMDKILRGAKPAELPVEQPREFILALLACN